MSFRSKSNQNTKGFYEGLTITEAMGTNLDVEALIDRFSPKQREFLSAEEETVIYTGAKRSGKTLAASALAVIMDDRIKLDARIVFASATIEKVKALYWNNLSQLNKNLKLGWIFHSGKNLIQTLTKQIVFQGLRDESSARMQVGFKVCCLILEEAHTIRQNVLHHFWHEVIRWNTANIPGARMNIICNPPHMPVKFLEDIVKNPEIRVIRTQMSDNPWMTEDTLKKFIKKEAQIRGFKTIKEAKKSPAFRRAIYGEWAYDTGSVIFDRNRIKTYKELPSNYKSTFTFVVGADIGGGRSYDAVVVLGYSQFENKVYVIEEFEEETSEKDVQDFANKLKYFYEKYKPTATALDFGGHGERIAHVLMIRYGVVGVIPAKKVDKISHLLEMRTEAYRGRLIFSEDSKLMKEFPQIIFNDMGDEVDDKNGLHSDLLDACLYSFRHIYSQFPKVKERDKTYSEMQIEAIVKANKRAKFEKYVL